jgi:hypothetical protein
LHLKKKGGLIREVASLERDNRLALYYISASGIWPDKRGDLWLELPYKNGVAVELCRKIIDSPFFLNAKGY